MWTLADVSLSNRMLLGTALYPSPDTMRQAIQASGAEVVTVSLRRQQAGAGDGNDFWHLLNTLPVKILPNTAGCHSVREAVTTAQMARELFETNWIKLEVIGDEYTLQPDTQQLLEATKVLIGEGFEVFPYTTDDLVVAQKLVDLGCRVVMPWASPIGSGQGLLNPFALRTLRARLPQTTLIVDAGIGRPSDAAIAMELGFDAILLNSAVALSRDPVQMAAAFKNALLAGRAGFEAGVMQPRDMAHPSTPTLGTPFWQQNA